MRRQSHPKSVSATITFGLAGAVLTGIGCGGDDVTAPNTGSIEVTAITGGPEPDADGYAISIDGGAPTVLGANGSTRRDGVDAGEHSVQLSGIAPNCSVQGSNPSSVTVAAGATAAVSFAVACAATTGSLEITTATTGASPDPDGYTVTVDNSAPQTIGNTAALTVGALSPAAHLVTLAGVATNCRVEGDNPRQVTVTAGAASAVAFTINCSLSAGAKILWEKGNGKDEGFAAELYVMNADGSGQARLTSPATILGYQWSPDASKIAFARSAGGVSDIYVMNADGSGQTNLTRTSTAGEEYPVWLADGRKISFQSTSGFELREIHIMNADGSGRLNLTNTPTVSESGSSWSPDGSRALFVVPAYDVNDHIENVDIYVMNSDGTGRTQLTHNPLDGQEDLDWNAIWSPDGRRILFVHMHYDLYSNPRSSQDIYVMDAEGSGRTNLTQTPESEEQMAEWSPDGRQIVFMSGGNIYVMNSDGGNQTNLTGDLGGWNESPSWSPDGSKIAFSSSSGGSDSKIWVMNADGSAPLRLTSDDYPDYAPTWSP
jgi:Tol biopolymer transport system component